MKDKTVTLTAEQLIEDFDLYPRADIDSGHVAQIMDAITAGAEIPPIIACSKSKRIVDGFHRCRAFRRLSGDFCEIQVILRDYKTEKDLFLDAMRFNSCHGRNMTSYDRTHAMMLAERLEIAPDAVASALNMTVDKVTAWKHDRAVRIEGTRRMQPLKMPIRHMLGQTLTQAQSAIVPKLGGNQQLFYVRQLRMLLDNAMLDLENEILMEELRELAGLVSKI
jgi:hypothetical protein